MPVMHRMTEFVRIAKVSHLRTFTRKIKMRKLMISCCDGDMNL